MFVSISCILSAPPMFIESAPPDLTYSIPITQSDVTLEHKIQGFPLPITTWLKDGVPLVTMGTLFEVETSQIYQNYIYTVTTRLKFVGKLNAPYSRNGQQELDIGVKLRVICICCYLYHKKKTNTCSNYSF